MRTIIYLDHASTTPLHPDVKKEMDPFLDSFFGNPSSMHQFGRITRAAVDNARCAIATVIGAHPREIIFTSGGTEANNLALMGVAQAYIAEGKNHLITSQIEHYAVLKTCQALERMGFEITYLPVNQEGIVDLDALKKSITPHTSLISIMYGNNEVGTLQPVQEIGDIAKEHGVFFHSDAIQALGVEEIDVHQVPIDLLSLSSHKVNGPKGIGALYVSKEVRLVPGIYGGGQERNRRAGTENVPCIVGFGKAVEMAVRNKDDYRNRLLSLREVFLLELTKQNIKYVVNGSLKECLPHILNMSFLGMDAKMLLMNFDLEGIGCSGGSTCNSGVVDVSHVLKAMGLSSERCTSAIRFSFGFGNTKEEIRVAAQKIAKVIGRLENVIND